MLLRWEFYCPSVLHSGEASLIAPRNCGEQQSRDTCAVSRTRHVSDPYGVNLASHLQAMTPLIQYRIQNAEFP